MLAAVRTCCDMAIAAWRSGDCPAAGTPNATATTIESERRCFMLVLEYWRVSCFRGESDGRRLRKQRRRNTLLRRLLERVGELDQPRLAARHPREADAERFRLRVEPFRERRIRRRVGHHRMRNDH